MESLSVIPPFGKLQPEDWPWLCSRNCAANCRIAVSGMLSNNLSGKAIISSNLAMKLKNF